MSQTPLSPPPPLSGQGFNDPAFHNWLYLLYQRANGSGQINTSQLTGTVSTSQMPALSGDVTTSAGSTVTSLSTVNSTAGSFGDQSNIPSITVDSKGRVTNVSSVPLQVTNQIFNTQDQEEQDEKLCIPPPQTYDFDHVIFPAGLSLGSIGHIYTLTDLMAHEWSSGIVNGAAFTDNGNGTIGIGTSIGVIRPTNDGHVPFYGFSTPAQPSISLTDNAVNYIYIYYNAGNPTFVATTNFSDMDGTTKVLTYVVHRAGNVLHYLDVRDQNVDTINKITALFSKFSNFIHASGGTVLGSSGLAITVTAGSFFYQLQEKPHTAFDTSVAGTAIANVFGLWYRNGVGGWTEVANSKVIDTTVYDNNTGTPVAIGNNKFGVTWFYIVNDTPSELHAVMGDAQYPDLATAAAASPPGTLPSLISGLGSLIGFVAYQKGNTVFDNVYSAFTVNFVATQPTIHNGLSGLQGGTGIGSTSEYYHFTNKEHLELQQLLSMHVGFVPQIDDPEDPIIIPGPQGPSGTIGPDIYAFAARHG